MQRTEAEIRDEFWRLRRLHDDGDLSGTRLIEVDYALERLQRELANRLTLRSVYQNNVERWLDGEDAVL